ncbi:uncharacterized protein [Littorina saxatilis]|uniref:Uncharacterized protein n=1 Tax=Littorina saxatilis TaxID=31220 RepID=A0AAN9GDQ2_9CAEN
MFRVQPDGQDERVSFLGVQNHIYEVMPGEESTDSDPTASDSTSNADCFLHIACPSSDSSLSEEDLRSIASTEVNPAPMMTQTSETSSTPQAMEETDGNAAAMCQDVGVPRAFQHPVASFPEAATRPLETIYENTTTLRTNSSLQQPSDSAPKAIPLAPKTSASKTTGTIASGCVEASAPKTMLQPFQTTTKRSGKPSADYLHHIASVPRKASAPKTTLQPSNKTVTKATATQKENPPDDCLQPVESAQKAASAQQNKTRILKTAVTKAIDLQSQNPSDDYLHPIASTFEATSTSNTEQHSDPAAANTTGAAWTSTTLHEDYI